MALNRKIWTCFVLAGLLPAALLAQADRIAGKVDASRSVKLTGNLNPQAKPASDVGVLDPATRLNYVRLMLKPSAAQQAALDQLLSDQQKPGSPDFRKWLTPEQFADRFGASKADIARISEWMQSQGFDIITVGRARRFIAFNATAGQIQNALKTEIHQYRINGELHFANAAEPSVPQAIQPLVLGFMGLDDFQPKAQSKIPSGKALDPHLAYSGQNVVGPGDLGIIYDLIPVWKAGYTGSGGDIAVIGRSNVQLSDINAFRSAVGLPANPPQLVLVPGSTDPGLVSGDQGESDLDLEYSGAIAIDAQILFVYASQLGASLNYAIDQALAPVISYSYAGCELNGSSADAMALQVLAQQANAEGITWVASAGDQGAGACDGGAQLAIHGDAVNLPASIPEVTGVGGTMFAENGRTYWSPTNDDFASALSYIPETVWNESAITGHLSAGGGGFSAFFTRPAWQVGPGIPSGTARGVPDVSLASGVQHDPYLVVENGGQPELVGGTSAAAPVFAGIVLLLNQYLGTYGLGNINPNLYFMAQTPNSVFHDITTGGNTVPCAPSTPNCGASFQIGYNAGPGWDAASGLGSVDVAEMLIHWNTGAGVPQIRYVLNAASLANTGLSPGLIFTIFGAALGPPIGQGLALDENGDVASNLAGVSVLVNGTPAPLLYLGANQINAVAPYELASSIGQSVVVQIDDNGVKSSSFNATVVAAAPAIFSLGNGQGAILNQDGSVNGPNNPAARGTYIQIFGTGEGQTNPAGVDGQIANESVANLPRPVAPFSLTIGGVSATYSYAGTAPQSFAGLFQVDALIPASVKTGNQPVILKVGNASSAPLNVAVK
ncbi:MAG TPA: protease pro-enzyme activation domain-containing protein [Bryobacteraceae bacterium]|nr:protease pro-enzyme activation domain-containing protein [Bryobacteraceae bacterium]